MNNPLVKILLTKIVVILIVLPIPPSTVIGLAIIANPKTNKYLDDRVVAVLMVFVSGVKKIVAWKVDKIRSMM